MANSTNGGWELSESGDSKTETESVSEDVTSSRAPQYVPNQQIVNTQHSGEQEFSYKPPSETFREYTSGHYKKVWLFAILGLVSTFLTFAMALFYIDTMSALVGYATVGFMFMYIILRGFSALYIYRDGKEIAKISRSMNTRDAYEWKQSRWIPSNSIWAVTVFLIPPLGEFVILSLYTIRRHYKIGVP